MLLYAFGDVPDPRQDTIHVLEEIVLDFLGDMAALARQSAQNPKRIKIDDLRYALRRPIDARKLARAEELLYMNAVIQNSRKLFEPEVDKEAPGKDGQQPTSTSLALQAPPAPTQAAPQASVYSAPSTPHSVQGGLATPASRAESVANGDTPRVKRKYVRRKPLEKKEPKGDMAGPMRPDPKD